MATDQPTPGVTVDGGARSIAALIASGWLIPPVGVGRAQAGWVQVQAGGGVGVGTRGGELAAVQAQMTRNPASSETMTGSRRDATSLRTIFQQRFRQVEAGTKTPPCIGVVSVSTTK